ncbi:MAG: hypothetical protein COA58_14285 [Bacteroidetes bacterium]|nr:MAG: hypothetical protein COA58_14285 [Bacteroidota bacterium]
MKKKFTIVSFSLLCLTLLFSFSAFAQESPSYTDMMDDNSYNFYDVVTSANAHFDNVGRGKGSGWKKFERWRNENESKFGPSGRRDNVDMYIATKAYKEIAIQNLKTKSSFDNGWEELGPWDANNVTSHYSPGIGRIQTFWVNPNNSDHMFLGNRGGGFWRTTNGGSTWENTTDFLPASGVFAIAVNPNNFSEVLIAVTSGGSSYTHGIYRSTNGGTTWSPSEFNPTNLSWGGLGDNERIYKIAYHPNAINQVYVCSSRGLYVSDDNLTTWNSAFTGTTTDVAFHPTDSNTIYAFRNSGNDRNLLKKSTNKGATFFNAGAFPDNSKARIYISTSSDEPDHVYAGSKNNVYKSTDKGDNFTALSNPDENCLGFAVSDLDVNNMVYGYVNLHASTDNGNTFVQRTIWSVQNDAYIHADLQIAQCINGVFYVGTDGYFAKSSDNGVTWTRLNDGTSVREFYAVGTSQGNFGVHMAGSQDNGTSILLEDGWVEWNGGDGMEALVHSLNPDWFIGSWQYGSRNYSRDGGLSRNGTGNPNRGSSEAAWEAPFLQNPMDQMQVYHFSDSIFSGDRFGRDWSFKSSPEIGVLNNAAIAETDSNVIVVSRNNLIRLTTDGGANWTNIHSNLPTYNFTDLAIDPRNKNTILATYNRYQKDDRKVFISYDQGGTWENITYNLGEMPLRTVVMDHSDSSYIYVGGEIGIYYKSKNATSWTLYNTNLPNVTVKDLEIHYGSNRLRAATWGRGLWENTLIGRNDFPSITHTSISSTPDDNTPKEGVDQYVSATIVFDGTLTSVKTIWSEGNNSLNNEISMSNMGGNIWKTDSSIGASTLGDVAYFRVIATAENGDESETYMFNYDVQEFKYCDASGSSGTGADYINLVELNGMSNSSNQDYYGDFTDSIIDLERNLEYTLTVGMNYHWDQDSVTAWIDYNKDANFTDDEQIIMSELDGERKSNGTFIVPADAILEQALRMRVRSQYYSSVMYPCEDRSGEVEDYTIMLTDLHVGVAKVKPLSSKVSPNPSSGQFDIELGGIMESIAIELFDITGKSILRLNTNNTNKVSVNQNLASGPYTIKITTEKGSSVHKMIVN